MKRLGIVLTLLIPSFSYSAEWLHCGQMDPESVQIATHIRYVLNGQIEEGPALSVMYDEVTPFYIDNHGHVTSYDALKMYRSGPYYYVIKDYDDVHQANLVSTMQVAALQPWICLTRGKYTVYLRTGATLVEAIRATPIQP